MRWTVSEFLYELGVDGSRRVLFVEGARDVAFWNRLVPVLERANTAVYPISYMQIEHAFGG